MISPWLLPVATPTLRHGLIAVGQPDGKDLHRRLRWVVMQLHITNLGRRGEMRREGRLAHRLPV